MEWVNPRCANNESAGFIHKLVMTSMSGMLFAMAPQSNAFLPSFFPAISSPVQMPMAICVIESNVSADYGVNKTGALCKFFFRSIFIQHFDMDLAACFIVFHDN